MPFTANITRSRAIGRFFMLNADALKLLAVGPVQIFTSPTGSNSISGTVSRLNNPNQGKLQCADLYNGNVTSPLPLPLKIDDVLHYDIMNKAAIRLQSVDRKSLNKKFFSSGELPKQQASPNSNNPLLPPSTGLNLSSNPLLRQLVQDIHQSAFVRQYKTKNGGAIPVFGAPTVLGWDQRILEYSYAKSEVSCFDHVYHFISPVIGQLRQIINRIPWAQITNLSQISSQDLTMFSHHAQTIHIWGGVPKSKGYNDAWKIARAAVTGNSFKGDPMDSGWTKFASFATDGMLNAQTIWDSRVSTSIICRIDQILQKNQWDPVNFPFLKGLQVVSGRGGTRPRKLNLKWPHGSCTWPAHLAGSAIVRAIVDILNDPKAGYPRMPQPNGQARDWDMFGVGLVLFMDGY